MTFWDKQGFRIPHTYALIFYVIIAMAILTWVIPAGKYDLVTVAGTNRTIVDPSSYHFIAQTPVSLPGIMQAIPTGFNEAGWIIFMVLIIGGAFGMINGTGAVFSGIGAMVKSLAGREKLIIPITMALFSFCGAAFAMAESTLVFIPMGVLIAKKLHYDAATGMAMIAVGAWSGFAGGAMNAFTVGVAQTICGLPLFSGMAFRIVAQIIFLTFGIWWVASYALKVQKDPTKSILYGFENQNRDIQEDENANSEFTPRHKMVMAIVLAGFITLVYGVSHGWSSGTDLPAIFLTMGLLSGIVAGCSAGKIADDFIDGARSVIYGALVIGLSRAIVVVMGSGNIIDTIIFYSSEVLKIFPTYVSVVGMFVIQSTIHFFISSGSGHAALTIPIMAPLGDVLGIPRQVTVLCYQYGDAFSNILYPTCGVLMAQLSMANIPYERWVKWMWPLFLIWSAIGAVLCSVATYIHLGPF